MTSYLRPDERAALTDIERSQKQDRAIKSGLTTAASLATGAGAIGLGTKALGPIASRIMPFINKYIPTDMALKGISKVSPELGKLLQKGMNQGLDIEDGLDFIKNQIQKTNKSAKENRNIIEQESPELHEFISQMIKKGETPMSALVKAVSNLDKGKAFTNVLQKLVKAHKVSPQQLVESIYGSPESALPQQTQTSLAQQQQPSQTQQQSGQGQQALMAILQKIQQVRGA